MKIQCDSSKMSILLPLCFFSDHSSLIQRITGLLDSWSGSCIGLKDCFGGLHHQQDVRCRWNKQRLSCARALPVEARFLNQSKSITKKHIALKDPKIYSSISAAKAAGHQCTPLTWATILEACHHPRRCGRFVDDVSQKLGMSTKIGDRCIIQDYV